MANYYTMFSVKVECVSKKACDFLEALAENGEENESAYEYERQGDKSIWFHSEYNAPEAVATIISTYQEHYPKADLVVIEWSASCSSPRLDAYGGGVVVIYKGKQYWMSTYEWAFSKLEELGYRKTGNTPK
jgi:hypothetical protein